MLFSVRELIHLSEAELRATIPQDEFHDLIFDDQEILEDVTPNETLYSWVFWNIFKSYENTPILKKHHVLSVLGNDDLDTSTHQKLCSKILESIVMYYDLFLPKQKEHLLELIYKTISDAQKMLILSTEEDVISLDAIDFVQAEDYSKIRNMCEEAMKDREKIKYAYDNIIKVLKNDPYFDNNNLAKSVRAKMVKVNQVTQCIGFRGIPSEVDGTMYGKPIFSNYTRGFHSFYDLVTDSRTAAKSHFYSDSALKDSEYRARKFQLNSVVLERIVYKDCGSDDLMTWKVKGPVYDASGTVVVYPGDLPFLIGKHYIMKPGDKLMTIRGDEEHLIGEVIFFRHVCGCHTPNPHEVCHVCAGYLTQNISRHANIGHLGTVTLSKDFTQNILSIKHVNMSSVMISILLGEYERKFLHSGKHGDGYYLQPHLANKNISLTVMRDEAAGLLDISKHSELGFALSQVSLPRISSISRIGLNMEYTRGKRKVPEETILNVSMRKMIPMLSRQMLDYISVHGWEVDEDNNFVFNMTHWDYDNPVLVHQAKEVSFVDLADEVKSMIQSSQKQQKKRIAMNAHKVLLQELFDKVNSKLAINILSMEIIIYGLMTASNRSIALARGAKQPVLGISDMLTIQRSLGAAMAFEAHESALFEPCYYFKGTRPDNPMDVFLCPREVLAAKGL